MCKHIISIKSLSSWYGGKQVLEDISLDIPENSITAFIGPSGCGKTTLLRSLNRLNDLIPGFRLSGKISIDGKDVYADNDPVSVRELRKSIGMVF